MAEEYQLGSGGNWWQTTTPPPRPERGSGNPPPPPPHLSNYGWQTDIMDIKTRSSMEPDASVSGNSMVFSTDDDDPDQKLQESSGSGLLADPTLQMMDLGLSSHNMDWNPPLFHERKAQGNFRTMLQEDETSTNYQQQQNDEQWREKLFGGGNCININNNNEDYKQMGGTCQDLNTNFQVVVDSTAAAYNANQNHALLQGLLVSENQQQSGFYGYPNSYAGGAMHNTPSSNQLNTVNSWSKFPQFLRGAGAVAPPPPPKQEVSLHGGQLQFSNNAPFWNANSSATTVNHDGRSGFFPAMQSPLPASNFQEKAKNNSEVRDSVGTSKKISADTSSKRAREDTVPTGMPAFKVRKEKMGDRITALQQLVSPFGKTDTASVLSEAIEYIKFLHEQVSVLSTPYMKSGAHLHQNFEKTKDPEGPKQDLRTRGLCLVPVSSTFPVTHETTIDYWNPTFGGTFR